MKAPVSQADPVSNFPTCLVVVVGRSATPPLATQSAAMGQSRHLNCQPAAYIPALPCVTQ